MTLPRSFTGRTRQRKTGWAVRAGEVLSRTFITVGGLGTIAAVCMIAFFLLWVVVPLFLPGTVSGGQEAPLPGKAAVPLYVGVDEDQTMGWALLADGTLQVIRLDTGQLLVERRDLFGDAKLTAFSRPGAYDDVAFGFDDGSVRSGTIQWKTTFLSAKEASNLPAALRDLPEDELAAFKDGLLRRSADGQFRFLNLDVQIDPPLDAISGDCAVVQLDHSVTLNEEQSETRRTVYCLLTKDGRLRLYDVTKKEIGQPEVANGEIRLKPPSGRGLPAYVLLSGLADNVYVAWDRGTLYRFNTLDVEKPQLVEVVDLLVNHEASLTALGFLNGKTTLLAGDSGGRIRAWFGTKPDNPSTSDGVILRAAHEFPGHGSPVTALAASNLNFMMAAGYADGSIRVNYVTSEKQLARMQTANSQPVRQVILVPKNTQDVGVLVVTPKEMWRWQLNPGHPEATLAALFLPVWYEGKEKRMSVWQSGSSEPKLGLMPLVFGTLKATFYSLLIGVPLALLAAIYTSEFLHPRLKAAVKPTIELMASLPSVVLGFLAAIVIAPFVDTIVPAFLAVFFTVPVALLVGAYIWQLLPEKVALRLGHWRFLFICGALPFGLLAAYVAGPILERLLFDGNFKGWLTGSGSGASGWLVLLLPLTGVGTAWSLGRWLNPWLRRVTSQWDRAACGAMALFKFLAGAAVAVAVAWLAGLALNGLTFDPRGTVVGTYEQRNSLIVGFVMGFAVIPIVYTIAEDALSAVPEHLRSASLGCGATPWQTATRIIMPTAMSGLFAAVMIGLGRAVGETMIVLMAAGNTPIMDLNIFNGFRTLSANIAVEMPEAVRGSTHYRVLFLAGLVLFGMTFVLNTIAEMVRLQFRKRAYQL
jgi:phosphate transport system permease protein